MRNATWIGFALSLGACSSARPPDAAYEDVQVNDLVAIDTGFDTVAFDTPLPVDTAWTDAVDATRDVPTDAGIDAPADVGIDAPLTEAGSWTPYGTGTCNARVRAEPLQPAYHVDMDAGPITWWSDPPTSGPHYPIWAHWGAFPHIPPGYWVHNLEHGGVVFLYPCPIGTCDAMLQQLAMLTATFPTDPVCAPSEASPVRVRTVVTDYTPLEAPVMAVAWGWMYAADCVDDASLTSFYLEHRGMGPEDFCTDGYYP